MRFACAGLAFEISQKAPAATVAADGTVSGLTLAAVDKLPNGVRIKLSPGVEVVATSDRGEAERFSLSASAPDGVAAIRLRVSARDVRLSDVDGRRNIVYAGHAYDLTLGTATLDQGAGTISLRPGDPGLALARIAAPIPVKPTSPKTVETAASLPTPKDPEIFKAEVAAWRDKVWSGLASTRMDADKLAWKGSDSSSSFSERALVAYLAEALARDAYPDALARAKVARDRWPDKLGFLSAPYLGGLVRKMKAMEAADMAESKRLAQLVADKSTTILEKEGLLRFLVDRAPSSLAQDAFRFLTDLDPSKLSVRQAVGYLACSNDAKALLKDETNPLRAPAVAADRLIGVTRRTPAGCFIVTDDDGSTDVRVSLIAGEALLTYGSAAAKPASVGAGQALVEGVIGLADAQGIVPARAVAASDALGQKSGSILPEDIYPLVADNPYYPHEKSFALDLGPGVWAWTCAPSLTAQSTQSRYTFLATFPAGRSHFLSFYGIKPFANIQLYDIDYNPDNDFESYDASGYLYNRTTDALYMKMRHKKDVEDIKLSF